MQKLTDLQAQTNSVWKQNLSVCLKSDLTVSPRGMEVKELLAAQYRVPMPAFLDLDSRAVNVSFMLAEAAWILSGSNRVAEIEPFMKRYSEFSDDQVFMRGGYGPKVVDQLGYVVDAIAGDVDTRQAVMSIWRERPAPSKDIPCTVSLQALVRNGKLNLSVYMRSQDIVLGFTYDVFTFSMIGYGIMLLLADRGIDVELGDLYVTAGSLHLYSDKYVSATTWMKSKTRDPSILVAVASVLLTSYTYDDLVFNLLEGAKNAKKSV